MAMRLYYGSGSPYTWRVWLGLEHKALPFELVTMSFASGELKSPAYLAMNPLGKVPVLDDDGFVVYESAAILEYLDDAYPTAGKRLFPGDVRKRATTRRLVREADEYLAHALEAMVEEILFKPPAEWVAANIDRARQAYAAELGHFEAQLRDDWFSGEVGAADFTIYPLIALALRMQLRKPDLGIQAGIGPALAAWMGRFEALPYFDKTYPPHWKAA